MQQMYSPMAQAVKSRGRGEDTMLVHMTPNEVNSLQGLAMANGGSLTINPDTGLPEAGFLGKILPTLLGAGLSFVPGVGPLLAAGLVAAGSTAVTGDIGKGLMAGLGAFGGANLAGALAGTATSTGAGLTQAAGETAAQTASTVNPMNMGSLYQQGVAQGATSATAGAGTAGVGASGGIPISDTVRQSLASTVRAPAADLTAQIANATTNAPPQGILGRFGEEVASSLPKGTPDIIRKAAPYAAGYGMVAPLLEPDVAEMPDEEEEYQVAQYGPRRVTGPRIPEGGAFSSRPYLGEMTYFNPGSALLPVTGYETVRMAEGDAVEAPAPAAGGLGATSPASVLPEYVKMFQTSPGAITGVPYGYGEGQSPMDIIRTQAAERQAIADGNYTRNLITNEITTTQPSAAEITPAVPSAPNAAIAPGAMEMDYGFMKSAPRPTGRYDYLTNPGSISPFGYPDANMYEMLRRGRGMAEGGVVDMQEGGFVMPARETAEFGNGSTMAGQRRLAQMGGVPIRGRGDGVSDSIPARIDGQQRAAVADGETYFPPRAVNRLGGAKKLRAMMDKATRSRQQASRGGKNKLRGLA